MIPGPVSGHVPVDPGGAQRPMTEAAGEAGADSGTSFADLLAAMLSPAAQLQAPGAAEAVFDRLDAAEMFNEAGLFRGAAPLPAQAAPVDAASSPAGVAAAPRTGLQADLDELASLGIDRATGALDGSASAYGPIASSSSAAAASGGAAGPASKSVHGAPTPSLASAAATAAGKGTQSVAAGPEAAGSARASSRTAALVAQIMGARTGAAAAQVSVQVAESGISVMARVDRLSREEQDRLRAEIGELLARHGLAGADIILNGEAWPLPQGEEQ